MDRTSEDAPTIQTPDLLLPSSNALFHFPPPHQMFDNIKHILWLCLLSEVVSTTGKLRESPCLCPAHPPHPPHLFQLLSFVGFTNTKTSDLFTFTSMLLCLSLDLPGPPGPSSSPASSLDLDGHLSIRLGYQSRNNSWFQPPSVKTHTHALMPQGLSHHCFQSILHIVPSGLPLSPPPREKNGRKSLKCSSSQAQV